MCATTTAASAAETFLFALVRHLRVPFPPFTSSTQINGRPTRPNVVVNGIDAAEKTLASGPLIIFSRNFRKITSSFELVGAVQAAAGVAAEDK